MTRTQTCFLVIVSVATAAIITEAATQPSAATNRHVTDIKVSEVNKATHSVTFTTRNGKKHTWVVDEKRWARLNALKIGQELHVAYQVSPGTMMATTSDRSSIQTKQPVNVLVSFDCSLAGCLGCGNGCASNERYCTWDCDGDKFSECDDPNYVDGVPACKVPPTAKK
jgi:hypothetical protein